MRKLEYTFKTDTLFKMLFVQYPELLKKLVADLLGISLQSIGHFHHQLMERAQIAGDFSIRDHIL